MFNYGNYKITGLHHSKEGFFDGAYIAKKG